MTKTQQEIIDRIKKYDGIAVVTRYGIYSRFGRFIAFPSSFHIAQRSSARDMFIKKFCDPCTKEYRTKVKLQHYRNVWRYTQLAKKCLNECKYESASKLAMSAHELQEQIDENVGYRYYFKLKEGI